MKKKSLLISALFLIFLCSIAGFYYLNANKQEKINPFKISVNNNELLAQSKEGYNSVKVYKQNNQLIINAKSEAAFFDGAQFTVDAQKQINASDIKIIWTTLGGGTEKTANNERIIAEIKIQESGELIFDKKINFIRKALDAVEDVLEKNKKGQNS